VTTFDSIPPLDAPALLKRFGLRANKRLGQNFLQDTSAFESIVQAAEIQDEDSVLEIGPGLGSLTRYLAVAAREVIAVELDEKLLPPLKKVLAPYQNVRLIHGDILKLSPSELIHRPDYLVVANIPYYITSAVIRHLLDTPLSPPIFDEDGGRWRGVKPRRIVLTIQKEVAERICAAPGDLSLLALSVQVYGMPKVTARVPAEAFYPPPKVDSAVIRIEIYPSPLIPVSLLDIFFKLIKAGFGQKRKTLRNALSSGLHIPPAQAEALLISANIDPKRRAETLSIEEWKILCERASASLL
jgi:16S rRNA (adenine1518-N6/adenine1519-N6)-dimethyltransferase